MARGDGYGLDLLVRVQPRLAGLQLDEVEHLGLALQQQVVEAEQDGGALAYGGGGPDGLRDTGTREGLGDVRGVDSGRSASFSPVAGVWFAVCPEPTTPLMSWASTSGVTTSAAVRARGHRSHGIGRGGL